MDVAELEASMGLPPPVADEVVMALEARGSELVGVVNVAPAGLVGVIADSLVCEAWRGHGINSPEHWPSTWVTCNAPSTRNCAP